MRNRNWSANGSTIDPTRSKFPVIHLWMLCFFSVPLYIYTHQRTTGQLQSMIFLAVCWCQPNVVLSIYHLIIDEEMCAAVQCETPLFCPSTQVLASHYSGGWQSMMCRARLMCECCAILMLSSQQEISILPGVDIPTIHMCCWSRINSLGKCV